MKITQLGIAKFIVSIIVGLVTSLIFTGYTYLLFKFLFPLTLKNLVIVVFTYFFVFSILENKKELDKY